MLTDIVRKLSEDLPSIKSMVRGRQTRAYLSASYISVNSADNTVCLTASVGLSPAFPNGDAEYQFRDWVEVVSKRFYGPAAEIVKRVAGTDYKVEFSGIGDSIFYIRPKDISAERLLKEEEAIKRVFGADVPVTYWIPTAEKASEGSSRLPVATH